MKKNINGTYKFGASLIALAFSLSAANYTHAQTCPSAPSCDELGYTHSASECATDSLKCPFDKTKYYCLTTDELGGPGNCDNPSVGSILYSNMSCSADLVAGKTPIGVVFNTEKRLAIALQTEQLFWSFQSFDVPGSTKKGYDSDLYADWNGKANTLTITSYCNSQGKDCLAFDYVKNYLTTGTHTGDWYLPALGELKEIYDNRDILNTALSKTGGTALPSNKHWSSTADEYSDGFAWYHDFRNGLIGSGPKSGYANYVRPILAF